MLWVGLWCSLPNIGGFQNMHALGKFCGGLGKGKLVVVVDFKLGGLAACGFERGTQAGKRRVALHQVRPSCRLPEIDDVIDPFAFCACGAGMGRRVNAVILR